MQFIADFHIHSHYSLATSKHLTPEHLDYWAQLKGIDVVGTGDCTHPLWLKECAEKFEDNGNGLYRLKKTYKLKQPFVHLPASCIRDIHFILTAEVSSIYKKNGKVRKVHSVCVFPDFESATRFQNKLARRGNIQSDGRPILGVDAKHILELVLGSSDKAFVIPAHIWTPWFSVLGSQSGFDSIHECYDELTHTIFALETGLSSDPAMNWTCSFLDDFRLVSNSDAHSPEKLGREANMFDTTMSYDGMYRALKTGKGFTGTIEFFPEEGKYHYDGHHACGVSWNPTQTTKHHGLCSVCGKPVTKGVMYRVAQLSDRNLSDVDRSTRQKFLSITPLSALLAEISQKRPAAKAVVQEYMRVIDSVGSEFHTLLFAPLDEIEKKGGALLREGIARLRAGRVHCKAGFDGEFGRVTVFDEHEQRDTRNTDDALLFSVEQRTKKKRVHEDSHTSDKVKQFKTVHNDEPQAGGKVRIKNTMTHGNIDAQQQHAIEHTHGVCVVIAGPGAGKTRVLTERIVHLVQHAGVIPYAVLALTFSNNAAQEMRERVMHHADIHFDKNNTPCITTFHAFGLAMLKEYSTHCGRTNNFFIVDPGEKLDVIQQILNCFHREAQEHCATIEKYKQGITSEAPAVLAVYEAALQNINAFDLDDLVYGAVQLLHDKTIAAAYHTRYQYLLVDEYQDVNPRQYEMIRLLAEKSKNLFVIGDPDQSIYGFRGASGKTLEEIIAAYPETRVIRFTTSYRCPVSVLRVGEHVLRKTELLDGKHDALKVQIMECATDKSEADLIATHVEQMIGGVRSFSMHTGLSDGHAASHITSFADFAILCRTQHQFPVIIEALHNHGIPCQLVGETPFYTHEPYANIIRTFKSIVRATETSRDALTKKIATMIHDARDIETMLATAIGTTVSDDDITRFVALGKGFRNNYCEFLHALAVRDIQDDRDIHKEAVSLLTLHAAKGLEFTAVFIAGCEKGIIPFELFGTKTGEALREEERLFYVGVTRTKQYLFLSHAAKRNFKGRVLHQEKSFFLDRLEKTLFEASKREMKKTLQMELKL